MHKYQSFILNKKRANLSVAHLHIENLELIINKLVCDGYEVLRSVDEYNYLPEMLIIRTNGKTPVRNEDCEKIIKDFMDENYKTNGLELFPYEPHYEFKEVLLCQESLLISI